MILSDIIRINYFETVVSVVGIDPSDSSETFYFKGALKDIPEEVRECKVSNFDFSSFSFPSIGIYKHA